MNQYDGLTGKKLIRRYNPGLIITCVFALSVIAILALYCYFPVATLTYTEAGIEYKVDVNAFTFLQAFYNRINTGLHTELGDSFLTFLRNQRGTTLNAVQSFLINGCGGRMEQVVMFTFVCLLLLICCFAIPLGIVAILGIAFGRLHSPKVLVGLTTTITVFLGITIILLGAFTWLYGDIINAVVENTSNTVTAGQLGSMVTPIVLFGILIVINIVIGVLYTSLLKGRVFAKRQKY